MAKKITLILAMLCLVLVGCSENLSEATPTLQIFNSESDRYLSDYDYMIDIIVKNYPYFDVAMTDENFKIIQSKYRRLAASTETDSEFYSDVIQPFLAEFDQTGHMSIVDKEEYDTQVNLLNELLNKEDIPQYGHYLLDEYNQPNVRRFYETSFNQNNCKVQGVETDKIHNQNLRFLYFPDYSAAYVSISSMLAPGTDESDAIKLKDFFEEIDSKDYKNCIIDIRGNGGGNDYYWIEHIVLPNQIGPLSYESYSLLKGEVSASYIVAAGKVINPIAEFPVNLFPDLSQEQIDIFEYYIVSEIIVDHIDTYPYSPLFSGRIWLLVDRFVYSASDLFAKFCKETGFATVVGTETGGKGGSFSPMVVALPNTGICFRFSATLELNPDGTFDEQVGTLPDIQASPREDELTCCLRAIRCNS